MNVGPFFYLNHPRIKEKGLYAAPVPHEQALRHENRLSSPLTHDELLGRIAPDADIAEHPRGNVVFDEESRTTIIYIDRCIEPHIDEVVKAFELAEWVVEYDENYVCPRCDHLADRF